MASWLQAALVFLMRWFTGAKAHGLPKQPGQRIYCANHTSHLDAVILLTALPSAWRRQTRPVAAADYWASGGLRRFFTLRVFQAVLIERNTHTLNPLGAVFGALRQGDSLIYFPEGTRGSGGGLQPLKPGIFYLARAFPQVDIVPVAIQGAHRILPKGAWIPRPVECTLAVGAPLNWQPGEDQSAFLDRLRQAMEQQL